MASEIQSPDENSPAPPVEPETPAPSNGSSTPDSGETSDGATAASSTDAPETEAPEGDSDGEAEDDDTSTDEESSSDDSSSGEEPGAKKKRKRKRKKKSAGAGEGARPQERAPFHVGEEVFGKVTAVVDEAIMVDLSGKALAIFDRSEMEPDDLLPEVGDRFVGRVHGDGGRGGLVVLTRKPLREEEAKPKIEQAAKDGTLIQGLITGVIKGGVEVLLDGLRAFAPASGVDLHPRAANLTQLLGKRLDFKVSTYDKQGRDVVVTRRPMLEKEAHERRKIAREALQEGAEMNGIVRTVVDWGAFVALPEAEYIEGLVHASEVSHNPREKVTDALKPGQKIRVKIQKIDEKGKLWLSRKALLEDPYAKLFDQIQIGQIIEGEVTRVEEFGAFIQLTDGVEGLCHVADMGAVRVDDARKVMNTGDKVRVLVHHFDEKQRRIGLHPAPPEDAPTEEKQKVTKSGKLEVEIVKIEQVGLHVRVIGATGRHARGFIPAGQTGTPRGAELRKHFTIGQRLSAMILDADPKRGGSENKHRNELKLSLTRLAQDEERKAHKEYRDKLKAEASFGTLGDLLKRRLSGD